MTNDQFVKKFGRNIFKLYKKFNTTENSIEKEYIRHRIYDIIADYIICGDV